MSEFYWTGMSVRVRAPTLDEAYALIPWDEGFHEIAPGVELYAAFGEPDEIEPDNYGPTCTCPPELVARGGFRSTCHAHTSGVTLE